LSPGAGARRDESFKSHYSRVLRLREVAARENPGRKIFLAGESMGGLISFILCARYPGLFAGLILLSPAFEVKEKPTFIKAAGMVFTALFLPGGEIKLPFDSSMCTRDEAYVNALDTHPSEYRRVQPGVIFDMFAAQLKAAFIKDRVSIPLLVLTAGEDKLVNSSATAKLFAALKAQDKQLIDFPEMYHSLSVDKGRENVFTEILKWAEKRI
jgi:alpha-beta hydrolase superfamily lysophospholipase